MIAGSRTVIEDGARRPPGIPGGPLRLACAAMGTRFEIVIEACDPRIARSAGEGAIEEILRLHRVFSPFERGGEIARVNRLAKGAWVRVTRDVLDLLSIARDAHAVTGGAFDPTIGPLMRARGFRGPATGDIDKARAGVGVHLVEVEGERLRFAREGVELDFGAIAKGYALDLAAEILRDAGVERAFLHGGTSSLVAIGPWRVALAAPERTAVDRLRRDEACAGATIDLREGAMGVSMLGGRESDDGRIGHVLDPRTGEAAVGALGAYAVGSSCALCDAISTALIVLGGHAGIEHPRIGAWGVWTQESNAWIERAGVRSAERFVSGQARSGTMEAET